MEASAQGAGAGGEQATREFPSADAAAAAPPSDQPSAIPDSFAERPELFVGAAFAGGFVLAKIVKRLGR